MSYELCNRPHSLWSLSGSVVEHWSAESEGLRFNSSWGLRILSSSHTCDETINIFLYIFPINKFDVNHVHVGSNAQSIMQVGQRSLGPLRSYATGIYIIVYWSYFTQDFRLWTLILVTIPEKEKKENLVDKIFASSGLLGKWDLSNSCTASASELTQFCVHVY